MLILFTDYGWQDPYVGQVKAVLAGLAPGVPVIDLLHAVPDFNAHAGAHLLDALARDLPAGAVVLAVVDPGVGGPREAVVVEAGGRFYVGPDNGLLSVLAGRAEQARIWRITWRPERLSDSFHGRDLFAPIAAWIAAGIAAGLFPSEKLEEVAALQVNFDLAELPRVLYLDHYGNAWTGIRGNLLEPTSRLQIKGQTLAWHRVFLEAGKGEAFWHVNSSGLVEISVNRGSAAQQLGLQVGDLVRLVDTAGEAFH